MRNSTKFLVVVALLCAWTLSGCLKDKCHRTVTRKIYTPVFMTVNDYWATMKMEKPRDIHQTGKIYIKDQYIFVNAPDSGIHIIDNSDPAAPRNISFLRLVGNRDMAIKGNTLYADGFADLAVYDISDPRNITLMKQLPAVLNFPVNEEGLIMGRYKTPDSVIVGYTARDTTYSCDCETGPGLVYDAALYSNSGGSKSAVGKGGSMARFTIVNDFLYTVNMQSLKAFDISNPAVPVPKGEQTISSGIETIFPYGKYLFIGSRSAMFIYDIADPAKPARRSAVTHFRACDPVVVEGNKAYVTIRSGNACGGNINQLQVFDVSNVDNPVKLTTVEMKNPFGLGVDKGRLFICEGTFGLRFLNAADVANIVTTKLIEGPETFDVIPYEGQNRLLVSAKDGVYQYDYSSMASPRLLSKISVSRP